MPRTARCPTCDTNVKVPDAAKRGSLVRCPSCEETFQPAFLKPLTVTVDEDDEHDPETAEAFRYRAEEDADLPPTRADHEKQRRRRMIDREHAARRNRNAGQPRRGWFEGIEGFFLLSAIVLAIGIPAMFFGVRRLAEYSTKAAAVALVGGIVVLLLVHFVCAGFFKDRRRGWLDWLFGPKGRD